MAVNVSDPTQLQGVTVVGHDGQKLGKVENVFIDDSTHRPEWAAVRSGLFGTHVSLVPLARADLAQDELRVPFDKEALKTAPHHDPDQELSAGEEKELFEHYGVAYDDSDTVTARGGNGGATGGMTGGVTGDRTGGGQVGQDTSGPNTDNAMTRSEERLRVGTEQTEAGRARLRKYVVTENVTQTVPVSHEEVRVEREPITESNRGAAMDGPAISDEEHEVTLHAERPVTQTEAVPVERVRMDTETVTEQEQVSGQVRKEEIDTDGIEGDSRRR